MAKQELKDKTAEEQIDEAVETAAEEMEVISEEETADEETQEDCEEGDEESGGSEEKSGDKKGFFGKAKKEKKDKKDLQIEELTDKYKRVMAEFDNFRKRTDKEKSQMYEIGAKDVIEKMLPIVDNFERGFASVSNEVRETPFAQGMDMVYKQLMKAFEELGVLPIEAVGKEFNPDFHNAVMQGEDEELGENIISEEYQKGYVYRDTVVRHSMVKVVNC